MFPILLVLLLPVKGAGAQRIASWTAHTSMSRAVDVAQSSGVAWVATQGGVFGYDLETGTIRTFTAVDGLSGVATTSIAVDEAQAAVWVGFSNGALNRIDSDTGVIQVFRDIQRAEQFPARGINRIVIRGDSLLLATEFGVVVFDTKRLEVRDSYSHLGSLPVASAARDVHVEALVMGTPTIWVATENGVARASLDSANLQDPSAWTVERSGLSAAASSVYAIESIGSTLFVGTGADLYERDAQGQYSGMNLTARKVSHLSGDGTRIAGAAEFRLILVEPGADSRSFLVDGVLFVTGVQLSGDGRLWISSGENGLAVALIPPTGNTIVPDEQVVPSGPREGLFTFLSVGPHGELWAGGANASNTGFHRLDSDGRWQTYSSTTTDILAGKARFLHVHAASDGSGWAAAEGGGVAHVDVNGSLTLYGLDNSSLGAATGTTDFIIAGGLYEDASGNMWFTTRGNGTPLHVRDSDGNWTAFGPMIGEGLLSRSTAYGRIFIDSFDQKWIVIRNENSFVDSKGIAVLETNDLADPTDDSFRFFGVKGGAGVGLPGIEVTSVAEDKDGLIWIGTNSGPAFFVNTGIIARDALARPIWPQWADRSRGTFMLFGLQIHDIAVDPASRIWFATSDGAWLVEPVEGGYALVEHFTADNSPLFSDEVLAVAINEDTGRVYFSTARGLVSFMSDSIAPSSQVAELKVFPNPVRISGGAAPQIFVEGLVAATTIRIVSPAGYLVRRLEARGGRMSWDGRDENGQLVSSGVYLVIAVGQNDEGTAYGKIAIIR